MQVFLSYAHADIIAARRLYADLSRMPRVSVWMDEKRLLPGEDWEMRILEALAASRFIILLLSQHSVSKEGYVQKEVRRALERLERNPPSRIVVIPVRIDPCRPEHEMLRRLQWVDLFDNWDEGVRRIKEALATGLPPAAPGAIPDLSGLWIGNYGQVELRQRGRRIDGRYEEDGKWHGELEGEVDGPRVIFRWRACDGSNKGMGTWRFDRGALVGGWFVLPDSFTFDDLRSTSDEELSHMTWEYPWVLGRAPEENLG